MASVDVFLVEADGSAKTIALPSRYADCALLKVPTWKPEYGWQQNYADAGPTPCFGTKAYIRQGARDGVPVFVRES